MYKLPAGHEICGKYLSSTSRGLPSLFSCLPKSEGQRDSLLDAHSDLWVIHVGIPVVPSLHSVERALDCTLVLRTLTTSY